MSADAFSVGVVLLALVAAAAAVTGAAAGRRLLGSWTGAPARLADAVAGVAVLILVMQLLGAVGGLRRAPLVVVLVVLAAAAAALARRRRGVVADTPQAPRPSRAAVAVAAVALALLVGRAVHAARVAYGSGIVSYDSLWYHLPFAATFAREGSVTQLQYVANGPTSFYPANGELVHTLGMLLFRGDVLSPLANVGWLALALLAGWCVGRPYGVAPATLVAVGLVAFLPVLGGAQVGTAGTDVALLALLLSAAALVVNAPRSPAAHVVAAASAGLAVGTKLDAWAPALALAVAACVVGGRRRGAAAAAWLGGIVVFGGLWYGRNLAVAGNPFPWFGGSLGLPTTTAPTDCGRTSLAQYLGRPGFLSSHVLPQLPGALGARWWLVAALAVAGIAAGLLDARGPVRVLAVAALASLAAYVVTPATAGGAEASCFGFNTRFATPGLALGLILLPIAIAPGRRRPLLWTVALAVAMFLTTPPPRGDAAALAVSIALVAAVSCFAAFGERRRAVPAVLAVLVALTAAAATAGRREARAYERHRYAATTFSDPVAEVLPRLARVRHARIAVAGIAEAYPFYGAALSNVVDYPARRDGARFVEPGSCRAWLEALSRGKYDYVVTAREGTRAAAAAKWTRRDPAARELVRSPPGATNRGRPWTWQLFRLDASPDAASACGG